MRKKGTPHPMQAGWLGEECLGKGMDRWPLKDPILEFLVLA